MQILSCIIFFNVKLLSKKIIEFLWKFNEFPLKNTD